MNNQSVQIPLWVYHNLVNHLKIHANTDSWANQCLEQLQQEVKESEPYRIFSKTYLLKGTTSHHQAN